MSSLLSVIDGDAGKCQRASELKLAQIPQWGFSGAVELRETLLLLLKCKDFGEGTKKKPKNATGDISAAILHLLSKSRRGRKESQGAFKVPPVVDATTPNLYNQRKKRIRWIHDWIHVLQIHVWEYGVCPQWVQICQKQCMSLQSVLLRTSFPQFPANLPTPGPPATCPAVARLWCHLAESH